MVRKNRPSGREPVSFRAALAELLEKRLLLSDLPIVSGQTVTGHIASAGQEDCYSFSASAGDSISVVMGRTGDSDLGARIDLYGPTGTLLKTNSAALDLTDLPLTGTYCIVARDDGGTDTGAYALTMIKVPGAQEVGTDGGAIGSDQTRHGRIEPGDLDVFTLSASVGDRISIVMSSTDNPSLDVRIDVYGPTGTLLQSKWNDLFLWAMVAVDIVSAPSTGTYYIVARDHGGDDSGSYALTSVKLPGEQEVGTDGGPIASDQTRNGTVDVGDLDVFTFSASAGDSIGVVMGESAADSAYFFHPQIDLYDPTGTLLETGVGTIAGVVELTSAPLTGTYYIVARDQNKSYSGAYWLTLALVPGDQEAGKDGGPIASNQTKRGTIEMGDLDVFTFGASEGDSINVVMDRMDSSALAPRIDLYGPGGALLDSSWGSSRATVDLTSAPESGTYYIVAWDNGGYRSGQYALTLSGSIIPPDVTPPGEVVAFAASGGVTKASLTWSNPSDEDLAGVLIVRRAGQLPEDGPVDGTVYVPGGTLGGGVVVYAGAGSNFTDAGLVGGTVYYYRAYAYDTSANYSDGASAVAVPVPVPANVTGLSASPADGQVNLAWSNPAGAAGVLIIRRAGHVASGGPVDGVSYDVGAPLAGGTVVYAGGGSGFADPGLDNGTRYYYHVYAHDSARNYASGVWAAATPMGVPSAPATVWATEGIFGDRVRIGWSASAGATAYEVWRGTSNDPGGATMASGGVVTGTTFDDTTAAAGTTYWYWIKAKNSAGTSSFSAGASGYWVADLTAPGKVGGLTAQGGVGWVQLNWTMPSDSDLAGVLIVRREGAAPSSGPVRGGSYSVGSTLGGGVVVYSGSASSFKDTAVSGGTSYAYAVYSFDSSRNYSGGVLVSAISAEVFAVLDPATHVLTISGTEQADSIVVTWSGAALEVTQDGQTQSFDATMVQGLLIEGLGGSDTVTLDASVTVPATVKGGTGDDAITGGSGADLLKGGGGKDLVYGKAGADTIKGGAGNDHLRGNGGGDNLAGGAGSDTLRGNGGRDTLNGGGLGDLLLGGGGDDWLLGRDGVADVLDGGAGHDRAQVDVGLDQVSGVEELLA